MLQQITDDWHPLGHLFSSCMLFVACCLLQCCCTLKLRTHHLALTITRSWFAACQVSMKGGAFKVVSETVLEHDHIDFEKSIARLPPELQVSSCSNCRFKGVEQACWNPSCKQAKQALACPLCTVLSCQPADLCHSMATTAMPSKRKRDQHHATTSPPFLHRAPLTAPDNHMHMYACRQWPASCHMVGNQRSRPAAARARASAAASAAQTHSQVLR